MKIHLTALIIIVVSVAAYGQESLFSLQTIDFDKNGNYGPNLKHFTQFGIVIGPIFSDGSDYLPLKNGSASFTDLNFRYKRKLNKYIATGFDIFLTSRSYELKQYAGKIIPDTITYFREYLTARDLGSGIYARFNFNKRRGNYLGNFFDVGISGNYVFSFYQSTVQKNGDKKIKSTVRGFDFYEKLYYSVYFRLGFQNQAFVLKQSLSPYFKSSFAYPDLPPISLGYEISF